MSVVVCPNVIVLPINNVLSDMRYLTKLLAASTQ